MDLVAFLSEENNYRILLGEGIREVRRRSFHFQDEAEDVAAEALESILDYFQRRPDMLVCLEKREKDEMRNYLRKAVRNQVLNKLKRLSRERLAQMEILAQAARDGGAPKERDDGFFFGFLKRYGFYLENKNQFSIEAMKQELHLFVEEKYGREKWVNKKETINIYLERFEKGLSLDELKSRYPQHNIRSLNSEAYRLVRRYLQWVRAEDKSRFFYRVEHD